MRYFSEILNINNFNVIHDNLTSDDGYIDKLIILLKDQNFRWHFSARIDHITKKQLKRLSNVGCSLIFWGIETIDSKAQKIIGKSISIDNLEKIKVASKYRIHTINSFMFCFPEDSLKRLEKTLNSIFKIKLLENTEVVLNEFFMLSGANLFFKDPVINKHWLNELHDIDQNILQDINESFELFRYYYTSQTPLYSAIDSSVNLTGFQISYACNAFPRTILLIQHITKETFLKVIVDLINKKDTFLFVEEDLLIQGIYRWELYNSAEYIINKSQSEPDYYQKQINVKYSWSGPWDILEYNSKLANARSPLFIKSFNSTKINGSYALFFYRNCEVFIYELLDKYYSELLKYSVQNNYVLSEELISNLLNEGLLFIRQ